MLKKFVLGDEKTTMGFATSLARHLWQKKGKGLLHLLFTGGLGMGKTKIIGAMIREFLGNKNLVVASPTFSLITYYDNQNILHGDFYRLANPDDILELGLLDEYQRCHGLIEWSEKLGGYLPENYLLIKIKPHDVTGRVIELLPHDGKGDFYQEAVKSLPNHL